MVRPRNVNRYVAPKEIANWEQEEFASRTEIKLAAQAVTDLGEQLMALPNAEFKSLNLPEELLEAIQTYKKLGHGPALKRQKAFIGKLLRKNEPLIIEIKEKIDELEFKRKHQNVLLQRIENWRDRLINEGDVALGELLELYPQADRQQLRQWIRNAQKEAAKNAPLKSAKEIFKYLKSLEW
jgi:ribosome-associated protein